MLRDLKSKIVSEKNELLNLKMGIVIYVNPFSYLKIRKEIQLKDVDAITSDGIILKVLFNIFFGKKIQRLSPDFSSYFQDVFTNAELSNSKIYFVGTEENLLNESTKNIKTKFPKLNIVGKRNGFFDTDEEIEECYSNIISSKAEIAIVGMGSPNQERFLIGLKQKGFTGIAYACGGFLHQTASKTDYYPNWVNKFNLRWLYRIFDEPKLLKRYTVDYGYFLVLFIWDFLKLKFAAKN